MELNLTEVTEAFLKIGV